MTDARLLFLGRTGVGKSSLINFLAGNNRCDTDHYRPCTKEPVVISVRYGENEYELIDSPGLCESDDEIDSLYLELIDRFLLDKRVSPNLVFKSDDNRLRTEDYKLLKTLLSRYGNRILQNGGLMLTFAGNLKGEYDSKIIKRVTLITNAVYDIQISLGIELFQGFPRITLVDSQLKNIFEVKNPNNGIIIEDILASIYRGNQSEIVIKSGIAPQISKNILDNMLANQRQDEENLQEILSRINRFPFHNLGNNDKSLLPDPKKIAENPNTSVENLMILANHYDADVRRMVAENTNTSVEVLKVLANDDDEEVRLEVAQNLNTSVEILEILANDCDADVRRMVAENSKTPVEILNMLVNDEDNIVRLEVANNPNTAVNSLKVLAFDEDAEVRWGVAKNPNTPVEVLKVLVNDENTAVSRMVINNYNISVENPKVLPINKNDDVRFWDANDLNIPIEILRIFANDSDTDIRRRVANNPTTPVEILSILANDEDPLVRRIVAINCNTPQEILQFLVIDEDADVSLEVANNPNTPMEITKVLDEEMVVNLICEETGYKFVNSWEGRESKYQIHENQSRTNIHYDDGDFDNYWNIEGVYESESDKRDEILEKEDAFNDPPDEPRWERKEEEIDGQEYEESYQKWEWEQEKIAEGIDTAIQEYYASEDGGVND